jgi:hypothetical protein
MTKKTAATCKTKPVVIILTGTRSWSQGISTFQVSILTPRYFKSLSNIPTHLYLVHTKKTCNIKRQMKLSTYINYKDKYKVTRKKRASAPSYGLFMLLSDYISSSWT